MNFRKKNKKIKFFSVFILFYNNFVYKAAILELHLMVHDLPHDKIIHNSSLLEVKLKLSAGIAIKSKINIIDSRALKIFSIRKNIGIL